MSNEQLRKVRTMVGVRNKLKVPLTEVLKEKDLTNIETKINQINKLKRININIINISGKNNDGWSSE